MTITEFLLARVAEDEARAEYVLKYGDWGGLFKPPRILAECKAKRAIIAAIEQDYSCGCTIALDVIAEDLAAVYANHPDYQQAWA